MKRTALSVVILGVLSLALLPGCKVMSREELKSIKPFSAPVEHAY